MSEKIEKVIIEVAPLTRIPLSRNQSFSYLSDTPIAPGTLVSVPLFKRNVEGVVLSHKPDFARLGNIELRPVGAILEESFLDNKQLALADFIAQYYFSSLGIVLKSFIPKRVKARNIKHVTYNTPPTENIILTSEQKEAVNTITKKVDCKLPASDRRAVVSASRDGKIKNLKFLLYGPAGAGKTEVYIEAIKRLCTNKQALILLPELTLTPQALERYGRHFAAHEIAVLTSNLSKGAYYAQWQKIRSGEIKIIIGTRMAVFAPFQELGLIVVDEEQDISHKQWEMTPRYDARRVAEELATLHHCQLIFGSATPSLEAYHQTLTGEAQLVEIPHLEIPGAPKKDYVGPQIELVDMRKERWKTGGPFGKIINSSPISKKLQSEIAYALKNKLQIILFINRQGMSTFSLCTGCKNVLRCPTCERALVYDNSGVYKCSQCQFQTSITAKCPKCGGLEFKNVGLGTQKIEREVAGFFPQATIARVDSQTMQHPLAQEKIYADFSAGKIDILVGTQMLTKGWDLPNVALIGIIDADNMLSLPDFSTNVRAFQNIVQVAGRSNRPHAKWRGMVLIQTYNPQQGIFNFIAARDFKAFFTKEIAEREALHLPPFGKLIKLIFQDYDSTKVAAQAEQIYAKLEAIQENTAMRVSEPQDCYIPNIRGRYRKQIILKLKNKLLAPAIRDILSSLPAGWLIDVDPISII
ncbi:MAG: primosomal protein N' [Parcubacteria group bacterium]|jgi:primosomal protein N' (replication factor Y)